MLRMAGSAHCKEQQFEPAGNAKLLENSEHVIFYRMLANIKPHRNFTISQSFGNASDHVTFPIGQNAETPNIS
jgi:hypothetical protein